MKIKNPLTDLADLVVALAHSLNALVVETHISWVILADGIAYKIKKPVRLPFVDYSSLEARRYFCGEELRLNARLAPEIYLGITRITGTHQMPQLDGPGPVLEYAVRMRRFDAGSLFTEQLDAGTLRNADVDSLAALIATFHTHAPRAEATSKFANADLRRSATLAALQGVGPMFSDIASARLRLWIKTQATALVPLWTSRKAEGKVRECHGDLHLANVVTFERKVLAFDCIEFDPALRWIDLLDDAAFVVMDFAAHCRNDLAFRFLNSWLDQTGEHEALTTLRFAVVYRALIRAQVARLQGPQKDATARRYLHVAMIWSKQRKPRLYITHGLPGSGKTFSSQKVVDEVGAIRLRSDVERKRLLGIAQLENSHAHGLNLYDAHTTERTYSKLFELARRALEAGFSVILDAAFLRKCERLQALKLAQSLQVRFLIVDCDAPTALLRQRVLTRKGDASEATLEVLEELSKTAEQLDQDELTYVCRLPGTSSAIKYEKN